jgi:hypothetical protein
LGPSPPRSLWRRLGAIFQDVSQFSSLLLLLLLLLLLSCGRTGSGHFSCPDASSAKAVKGAHLALRKSGLLFRLEGEFIRSSQQWALLAKAHCMHRSYRYQKLNNNR